MLADAKELARRCKIVENSGLEVDMHTVIWNWDKFAKAGGFFKKLDFLHT